MNRLDSARLIVCERSGRWAAALRRELAEAGVRVWETRTLADCWDELAASPASFVVVEFEPRTEALLRRMARLPREFPSAHVAIVADRRWNEYHGIMLEAGAVDFVDSPRKMGRLARLACRHLAEAPAPSRSLTERIWDGLPWNAGERAERNSAR
ncbi:MAG: hypothetical protein ABFC77_13975 [Thermoguttaceae bacterium]